MVTWKERGFVPTVNAFNIIVRQIYCSYLQDTVSWGFQSWSACKGTWFASDSVILKYGYLTHVNSLKLEWKDLGRVGLWTLILPLSWTSCVFLDNLLNISQLHFLYQKIMAVVIKVVNAKHFADSLAHGKCSISDSWLMAGCSHKHLICYFI